MRRRSGSSTSTGWSRFPQGALPRNSDAGDEGPERQRDPRAKRNDGREADAAKVPICPIHALILINGEKGGCDHPCVMDVRFEVLRIHNVWTLTHSGPEVKSLEARAGQSPRELPKLAGTVSKTGGTPRSTCGRVARRLSSSRPSRTTLELAIEVPEGLSAKRAGGRLAPLRRQGTMVGPRVLKLP